MYILQILFGIVVVVIVVVVILEVLIVAIIVVAVVVVIVAVVAAGGAINYGADVNTLVAYAPVVSHQIHAWLREELIVGVKIKKYRAMHRTMKQGY